MRRIRWVLAAAALLALLSWHAERVIERRLHERLLHEAGRRGLSVSVERTSFSWWRPLRIERLRLARGPVVVTGDRVTVDWTFVGGRDLRTHVSSVTLEALSVAAHGLRLDMPATTWAVERWTGSGRLEEAQLREAASGGVLTLAWHGDREPQRLAIGAERLDLDRFLQARWAGSEGIRLGTWQGSAHATWDAFHVRTEGTLSADGLRIGLFAASPAPPGPMRVSWRADRSRGRAGLDAKLAYAGADVDFAGFLNDAVEPPLLGGQLAARVELGRALRETGLGVPAALRDDGGPLGTVTLEAAGTMRAGDPSSLETSPRLSFAPARALPALEALRGGFRHTPPHAAPIEVRAGTPDFVPYGALPPLFVRTLLIAEDAGFFGHPGIDVAEIPVAWARNEARGRAAFGASTITQQLVKNLFLSAEKTYARKAHEAALALLLDASVPKHRLLEIYVNVIEWGPGLYGLGPAARHYFGKAPAELTPKEIAFLVCLIPSPVRYHQAHEAGHVGPGMERLMDNLLVKLHSVAAIDDAELETARATLLEFRPEGAAAEPARLTSS